MAQALEVFLIAVGTGIAMNAPPGPGAAICISRTLREGLPAGLVSGFGIALGDAVLALLAMIALGAAIDPDWPGQRWIALAAAPCLLALAVYFLRRGKQGKWLDDVEPAETGRRLTPGRAAWYAGGMAVLAGAAPGTIPAMVVIFTGTGVASTAGTGWGAPLWVCAGIATGAMAWWTGVLTATAALRARLVARLYLFDYFTGGLLVIAAVYAAVYSFR